MDTSLTTAAEEKPLPSEAEKLGFKDLNDDQAAKLKSTMSALSTPLRINILNALLDKESLCVLELQEITGEQQGATSQALKHLKEKAWVKSERDGKNNRYRLTDAARAEYPIMKGRSPQNSRPY